MKRVTVWLCLVGAAWLAVQAGAAERWPEPVLPKDAMFFLEFPAPDRSLVAIRNFVNGVMGFPVAPDLEEALRTNLMEGVTLNSVEFTRPMGFIGAGSDPEAPKTLLYLPITSPEEFQRDLAQPYTGESLLARDGNLLVYEMPDASSYYLKFAGNYVLAGDDKAALNQFAAIPNLARLLEQRPGVRINGDAVLFVARHLFSTLEEKIPEFMQDWDKDVAAKQHVSATETAEMRKAVEGFFHDVTEQPQSLTVAASVSGRDLGLALRLAPMPHSGLARWIEANPGSPTLPYVAAIPDDAFMATVMHVDPASMQPLVDYLETDLVAHMVMSSTEHQQADEVFAAMRESMRAFTGEVMYAAFMPSSTREGQPVLNNLHVLGTRNLAAARELLDKHRDVIIPLLRDQELPKQRLVASTTREEVEGGVTAYHTVLSASVYSEEHADARAVHGDTFTTYVKPGRNALLVSTDRSALATTEQRLISGATAVFHPQESRYPGPKWSMTRARISGFVRMFRSLVAEAPSDASGEESMEKLFAGLPEPPADSSMFSFTMPRDGDFAAKLVIPETELSYYKLIFMRAMMQSMQAGKEEEGGEPPAPEREQ